MASLVHTLGLDVTVVCAPMAGVAGGRLAHAVSIGGGLGMIGVRGGASAHWLEEQAAIAGAGGTPFGIGLMAWVPDLPAQLETVIALTGDRRPALVSVSFGDLGEPVAALRAAGLTTACQVGNAADLESALAAGVDVVVARGGEGGGHGRDEMGTAAILELALATADRPVLAAGGISTAEDIARVRALGAAGVWWGTAFLTCVEADSPPATRHALGKAAATRYSRVHDVAQGLAWPPEFGGRAVETPFVLEWAGREDEMTGRARAEHAAGRERGDTAYTPLYAGVGVDLLAGETDAASVLAALDPG